MQWPAPAGYHIPTRDEWVALCGILTTTFGLAANKNTAAIYLKMPDAWFRSPLAAARQNIWTQWFYRSSTAGSNGLSYIFSLTSSSLNISWPTWRSFGSSLRCFKDIPVVPDNSWTTLYDWSSTVPWAGIFHNSSLWLISISADWTNWTTIQDKNLGATIVYNDGDVLSAYNCGFYYQWGNGFWFSFDSTTRTSSTKVDASGYWPDNYYYSDTFITQNDVFSDWSSVRNDNLRWWETWIQSGQLKFYLGEDKVNEMYLWTEKVYPNAA